MTFDEEYKEVRYRIIRHIPLSIMKEINRSIYYPFGRILFDTYDKACDFLITQAETKYFSVHPVYYKDIEHINEMANEIDTRYGVDDLCKPIA